MKRLSGLRGACLPALIAILALYLFSCATKRQGVEPGGLETGGSAQQGDTKVILGPAHDVEEIVSPAERVRCAVDAMKICATWAETGPAGGDSRTVSISVPDGPAIAVQCRYSGPGGSLLSAATAPEARPGDEAAAFLAAHGFCRSGG